MFLIQQGEEHTGHKAIRLDFRFLRGISPYPKHADDRVLYRPLREKNVGVVNEQGAGPFAG